MHWRYRLRKQQLLDECEIGPDVFQGGIERLTEFARPFAARLVRKEQREHARTYLTGLVSDLKRSACRCDEPERVALDRKRWLRRVALARFYRWKKCKRLDPLRTCLLT